MLEPPYAWDYVSPSVTISDHYHVQDQAGQISATLHCTSLRTAAELDRFYAETKDSDLPTLRVIYARNAPWVAEDSATRYQIMCGRGRDDIHSLPKWINHQTGYSGFNRQAAKVVWWPEEVDVLARVRKTSQAGFGFDYFVPQAAAPRADRVHLHLSVPGPDYVRDCDLLVRRIAVYIQQCLPVEPHQTHKKDGTRIHSSIEDCNTILIMVAPAKDDHITTTYFDKLCFLEAPSRGLSYRSPARSKDIVAYAVNRHMNHIIDVILDGLILHWRGLLRIAESHVELAQDSFQAAPADDSRAASIWRDQAAWAVLDKLLSSQEHLLSQLDSVRPSPLGDVDVDEDRERAPREKNLIQPTATLSDQMYKAIAYDDTKATLRLSLSLWRLSWITFIFLPLTFLVGYFGMNVDVLKSDPSMDWYFFAETVLMVLVMLLWYGMKLYISGKPGDTKTGILSKMKDGLRCLGFRERIWRMRYHRKSLRTRHDVELFPRPYMYEHIMFPPLLTPQEIPDEELRQVDSDTSGGCEM